jgi:hypothetical protein
MTLVGLYAQCGADMLWPLYLVRAGIVASPDTRAAETSNALQCRPKNLFEHDRQVLKCMRGLAGRDGINYA